MYVTAVACVGGEALLFWCVWKGAATVAAVGLVDDRKQEEAVSVGRSAKEMIIIPRGCSTASGIGIGAQVSFD